MLCPFGDRLRSVSGPFSCTSIYLKRQGIRTDYGYEVDVCWEVGWKWGWRARAVRGEGVGVGISRRGFEGSAGDVDNGTFNFVRAARQCVPPCRYAVPALDVLGRERFT